MNFGEGLEGQSPMGEIYEDYNETGHDDEEEEEEDGDGEGRGRPMLGFMFGNVDDSGDLDEEYLDQVPSYTYSCSSCQPSYLTQHDYLSFEAI